MSVRELGRCLPTAEVDFVHELLIFFDYDLLRQFGLLLSFLALLLFLFCPRFLELTALHAHPGGRHEIYN